MVFPGRLSTGCYVCRRRKVKCDGARPACRRCIAQQRECTGYPDTFAFRPYKSTGAGEALPRKAESKRKPKKSAATTGQLTRSSSPPTAITPCLEWQSLCYFFHQHVLHTHRSPCEGHLAFLPELYQERGTDPCLRNAILSVSYLSLFNASRMDELYVNARKHYGAALKGLTQALSNDEASTLDETFAAALFLSMFIDLSGEIQGAVNPHLPGICSLMHLRGRPQRSSKYARKLFGWAFTQVQIQAVASNQFSYACLPPSISMAFNPDYVLRSGLITSMISEFCQSVSEFARIELDQTPQACARMLHSLLSRSSGALDQINIWDEALPPHWKDQYSVPTLDSPVRDPWTTCFLAVVQAAQISFYQHVLWCCDRYELVKDAIDDIHLAMLPMDTLRGLQGRIGDLISVICNTVNSTLGHITPHNEFQVHQNSKMANGYTLLWPMWVIYNCSFVTQEHHDLCRRALECIGSTMGCRLASVLCMEEVPTGFPTMPSIAQPALGSVVAVQ
ncbi:hypothetical protein BO71DRAFT_363713 [Aspergillus ellipticus CBS 707.79]|uniref:Zn(2)-C6 fungal-type domain-containing protein n=1 Tax=Aspergillus ellipticus CBS 707.79 TaxID=1448320 RepID=A0A319DML8_9EURO|nr:hypothetical protein BO71DRAFT_363713 [Aspergillus ellipticus CBS 707.79]